MSTKTIITAILAISARLVSGLPTTYNASRNAMDIREVGSFNSVLTYYDPALGACGQVHGSNDLVVGVDQTTYGNSPNPNTAPVCGKRMRVNYQGRSIVLTVADKCMGCPLYGLDLTRGAWTQLVGSTDLGPQQGTWDWI